MKWYKIVFIIVLPASILIWDFAVKKKNYLNKMEKIEELNSERDIFYSILHNYFLHNNEYPTSIEEDLINKEESEDLRKQFRILFHDPFSKNEILKYIPIKNDSNLVVGYCLLSVGLDKTLDNKIGENLTLRDVRSLKLYENKSFNYFNSYFGKKDLLVSFIFNKEAPLSNPTEELD